MDADFAAVGVEGDGGEAGERGVDEHAGDGLVWHKLRVMMQQRRHLDGDTLVSEDDGGREQDIGFRDAGGGELVVHNSKFLKTLKCVMRDDCPHHTLL